MATTVVNGLSVQGIQDMVEMVKAQPQVAKAVFYATTIWKGGFHNEALVKRTSPWVDRGTTHPGSSRSR